VGVLKKLSREKILCEVEVKVRGEVSVRGERGKDDVIRTPNY